MKVQQVSHFQLACQIHVNLKNISFKINKNEAEFYQINRFVKQQNQMTNLFWQN